MGDTITFPDPYDRLIFAGNKAFEEEDFLKAKHSFQEAFHLKPSFELSVRVVETIQQLGDTIEAFDYTEDFLAEYLQDPVGFRVYAHLLMLAGRYLEAHLWLAVGEQNQSAAVLVPELLSELSKVEEVQEILGLENYLKKRQQLQDIDRTMSPISQVAWESFLQELTRPQFIRLMQSFLPLSENRFLIPKLVEYLVKLKVHESFVVRDFVGAEHEIDPITLDLPQNTKVYREILHVIEEQLGQENPILAADILTEIRGHFALSFPFLPAAEKGEAWAQSYITEYTTGVESLEKDEEMLAIQKQKEKLRHLLWNIQG